MKRILTAIAAFALFMSAALAAQSYGIYPATVDSIKKAGTAGMFGNEIDTAFAISTQLGTLRNDILYSGIGNPHDLVAKTNNQPAFHVGYYRLGAIPFSVIYRTTSVNTGWLNQGAVSVSHSTAKAVVSGTTTTDTEWTDTVTEKTATPVILAATTEQWVQVLVSMPAFNAGFGIFYIDNSSAMAIQSSDFYRTVTITHNYDSAAAATTSAPVQVLDYTGTEAANNVNIALYPAVSTFASPISYTGLAATTKTVAFQIPFAMTSGSLSHYADFTAGLGFAGGDFSYSYSETARAQAGTSYWGRALTGKASSFNPSAKLHYAMVAPGLVLADKGAEFILDATLSGWLGDNSVSTTSVTDVRREYDLTAAGSAPGLAGGTSYSMTAEYAPRTQLGFILKAQHKFRNKVAEGVDFAWCPEVDLSGTFTNDAYQKSSTETFIVNLDANGAEDAASTKDVVTTTNAGTAGGSADWKGSFILATGLQAKPAWLPFTVFLGAKPQVDMTLTGTTSSSIVTTRSRVNTAAGTTTTTTTIPTHLIATNSLGTSYAFTENHSIGFSFPFEGGAHLDATLGGNLLDVNNFTIEAYIPLGN